VHPYTAANFRQFVKDEFGRAEGMAGFKPSSEHFNAMYAFGDEHMVDGRSSVLALLQGPGDIVQIPAVGHMQSPILTSVATLSHLSTYMVVRRDVACNVSVGEDIADDYMAVARILNDAIVKACHQL